MARLSNVFRPEELRYVIIERRQLLVNLGDNNLVVIKNAFFCFSIFNTQFNTQINTKINLVLNSVQFICQVIFIASMYIIYHAL